MSTARIAAERQLLGAALSAPWVLDDFGPTIAADLWFRPPHAELWRRLCALRAEHRDAESDWPEIVLLNAWYWQPGLDDLGDLARLATEAPSPQIAPHAIAQMRRAAFAADLRAAAEAVIAAVDAGTPPDEIVHSHRAAMRLILARAT